MVLQQVQQSVYLLLKAAVVVLVEESYAQLACSYQLHQNWSSDDTPPPVASRLICCPQTELLQNLGTQSLDHELIPVHDLYQKSEYFIQFSFPQLRYHTNWKLLVELIDDIEQAVDNLWHFFSSESGSPL